ncbi:hypothetical protein B7H23_03080 [Notoacmeibacter marinus]|uniref:L,D-TPase catalytic domain-containing protein n=1 Tax=Notoacmeibacter marinus TaxID=1876515 RepID=A0A231V406_9HYPH|nr:L,D-transpeptidase [Notoacmeibacter marinus]OXT02894.1 hypothetical protein B7H23_03080 [Notoacmeibacter marinus]
MPRMRVLLGAGLALAMLAGCTSGSTLRTYSMSYLPVKDASYTVPRIPPGKVAKKYHRALVRYDTAEKPGTIVVDTKAKYLYFVMDGGKAMRYGIGVGREGFTWTPPPEMIKRDPRTAKWRNGQPPGLSNPLGARALYLHNKRGDTGYRLHGSPEYWSIGGNVSSGCIRMINQDVIDLYERAEVGAKVIVL